MTDLSTLIERVRKATGPDRELDGSIKIAAAAYMIAEGRPRAEVIAAVEGNLFDDAPRYTSSVDAALALAERVLPGWTVWCCTCGENDIPWAGLTEPENTFRDFAASAPTVPLAIVLATLLAIQSKGAS